MEAVEPGTVVQDSTGAAMNSIRHRCGISMFVLMAVEKEAFGGWQMSLREFNDYGIDPSRELAGIEFTGFPHDLVVYVIRDGKADAGTVRTGILESMAAEGKINLTDFRIGPYKDYGKLTFEDALSRYWYVIVLLIFVFVLTISFAAYVKKSSSKRSVQPPMPS
ncbi:MAG: phosphate/phosphite/phosphonate ABC transporter substrate-binding protein [Euryarchaeota archaeon]|nr:phosphate/phosphite/phosphonate ABC transporter substrate-binding protein [Euryarchaeota archaeon]MBU4340140.1 phosphate/phosphite/phosphonate ABC transporter substrate-binding protein [Euryarchaeota archaeon]MBU4453610.1 phosphate/phosphite/phosphonate ABC transporter substrate-binding protein [Euryarchaeota archaeon]MCG2737874.1 phosphate/phosphite/phosphonate ABC transporter substrate-binding protein [Candidatus Methanoperedenaceae archaeon]